MTVTVEQVGPVQAQVMLDNNKDTGFVNRPITKTNVAKFVRIIDRGEFRGTHHAPISLTPNGEVINGQHRLNAIIQSGKTVELLINRSASIADYDYNDAAGTNRPVGVMLTAKGYKYGALKAAAANLFRSFENIANEGKFRNFKLLTSETIELIDDYGDDRLNELCIMARRMQEWPLMQGTPTLGILMYAMKDAPDLSVAKKFTEGVADSVGIYDGDPRSVLQRYSTVRNGHARDKTIFYSLAWNDWLKNEPRKNQYKVDGKTKYVEVLTADKYKVR